MFDNSIRLIEMPEHNSISVHVDCGHRDILELGERLNERFDRAYMNGYNWEALITYYIRAVEPDLMKGVHTDSEAGMFTAYTDYSPENLEKMKRFEAYIRAMVANEDSLLRFIADNYEAIEWD